MPHVRRERWTRAVRIIPSVYPPVGLFDDVADPNDLEAVFAVEGMTNPRIRQEIGELHLVPTKDRISGLGTTPIMAAFTHPNPDGSRFSPGGYGVYYAGRNANTAISETCYQRERLMRYQDIGPQDIQMRAYVGEIEAEFIDLRGMRDQRPELYDANRYDASQSFGEKHRSSGHWGIVYDSVRHPEGECVAVFRPPACSPVTQGAHYIYRFDGRAIVGVDEVRQIKS